MVVRRYNRVTQPVERVNTGDESVTMVIRPDLMQCRLLSLCAMNEKEYGHLAPPFAQSTARE